MGGRWAALALVVATAAGNAAGAEFSWQTSPPERQGMAAGRLDALWSDLKARQTSGWLVIRNDRIVAEHYAEGWDASRPHYTASMAKAIVGGVAVAAVLNDCRMTLDDRASTFIPSWRGDPRKSRITIRELGSHTSGLADAEEAGLPHTALTGWKGAFWKPAKPPGDSFSIAREEAPVLFEPGTKLQYSNPGIAMLGYAVTAALKDAPEKDIRTLLRHRVMRPIGVADREWSVGYATTTTVDGLPVVAAWGGGAYTLRAVARVARLMLREGDWEGERLLDRESVRLVTRDAGTPGNAGIGWWSNNDGTHPSLPRDAFLGRGAGNQIVLVVPSLNLIAVRNGQLLDPARGNDEALEACLFEPLIGAVSDR